jgi:SagB-type dehydrogenase family enzyme
VTAPKREVSVEAALAARRSVRTYSKQALTLAQAGQLLWAAQGVTGPGGKRTAPSARARYPLEIVVVAQNVEGLAAGAAYRYLPAKHTLELLTEAAPGTALLAKAAAQAHVAAAPAVFVIASADQRMGTGPTNRTWCDYEAGLASENLLLQAVALGLGGVVTGGIDVAGVRDAVKLSPAERVVVVIPIGKPAN